MDRRRSGDNAKLRLAKRIGLIATVEDYFRPTGHPAVIRGKIFEGSLARAAKRAEISSAHCNEEPRGAPWFGIA
jgi:hypothetical protein